MRVRVRVRVRVRCIVVQLGRAHRVWSADEQLPVRGILPSHRREYKVRASNCGSDLAAGTWARAGVRDGHPVYI